MVTLWSVLLLVFLSVFITSKLHVYTIAVPCLWKGVKPWLDLLKFGSGLDGEPRIVFFII